MMNAKEVREIADGKLDNRISLDKIREKISEAAFKGDTSVSISTPISSTSKIWLEKAGFKIYIDKFETDISW